MTEESSPLKPSLRQRLQAHWRCVAFGMLLVAILAGISGLAYYGWQLKLQVAAQSAQFSQALAAVAQQEKIQTNKLAAQQNTIESWQTKQQQFDQQLQKLTIKAVSGSPLGGVISNLTHQLAIIQLLITHQQYALAINLLASLESEIVVLPEPQRQEILSALQADRERIQHVQVAVQQLIGQLQQLQQHINQQLLLHFGPVTQEYKQEATQTSPPLSDTESFLQQITQQLQQAVQIQHVTVQANPVLPAFYSGVMLQLALYQAQFALTQGNWMEFQLALTAVQAWLTPANLAWLPDRASVMQTVASLSQQPPAFSTVNVNATQQALVKITQELAE